MLYILIYEKSKLKRKSWKSENKNIYTEEERNKGLVKTCHQELCKPDYHVRLFVWHSGKVRVSLKGIAECFPEGLED